MQIFDYHFVRYCATERDLCDLHRVPEEDVWIEKELERIQSTFANAYPQLKRNDDYEFPPWHHNLRLFWAYLYSDQFYDESFIPRVQKTLSLINRSWFAEFECYSPSLKSAELPSGYIGEFLVFKDTLIFDGNEQWTTFKPKLIPEVSSGTPLGDGLPTPLT